MRILTTSTIGLVILFFASALPAEQRALLVGVGKYSVPGIDLPGIDLDLERMRETLNIMGFEDAQIRSLMDNKATSKNVKREFETWLKAGVKPDDRVVFYYSGHGSNIPDLDGDEDDGVDEVLVTHDVRRVTKDGKRTLSGVVDDDTLAKLIADIPSDNIWIIVDACHSGTMTRDLMMNNLSLGENPIFTKSFVYSGMPEGETFVFDKAFDKDVESNFVSMSAAGDGEKAIGTTSGGVFTIGLTKAIRDAAQNGDALNIIDLRDYSAEYIRGHVDEWAIHNPQVTGNEQLAKGALKILPLVEGNGPNRKKLLDMVAEQNSPFELAANKGVFTIGDPVELRMTIPIDGYLNVVSVDSQDNATVLFPNAFHSDHAVSAGGFTIPTDQMAFELPASEPPGATLVVAFVTKDPVNFYESSLDERDADGSINVELATMSHTATRAINVAPRKKEMYAAKIDVDVQR
jgi:hypothetical protein